MRTTRTEFETTVLDQFDLGVKDSKGRALAFRLVKERFRHVADPEGKYISYQPGRYITLLAYTLRDGQILPKSAPRVMREFDVAIEMTETPKFYKLVEGSRRRAVEKGKK